MINPYNCKSLKTRYIIDWGCRFEINPPHGHSRERFGHAPNVTCDSCFHCRSDPKRAVDTAKLW